VLEDKKNATRLDLARRVSRSTTSLAPRVTNPVWTRAAQALHEELRAVNRIVTCRPDTPCRFSDKHRGAHGRRSAREVELRPVPRGAILTADEPDETPEKLFLFSGGRPGLRFSSRDRW